MNKKNDGANGFSAFPKSKFGQGLSVNAIILIVLGMIVLVLLILGFTLGWGKILPFISSNNVENLVTSCNLACSTNNQYGFCSSKRELKADDANIKDVTCNYVSRNLPKYGVQPCPAVPCSNVIFREGPITEAALNSMCVSGTDSGITYQALIGDTLRSVDCK